MNRNAQVPQNGRQHPSAGTPAPATSTPPSGGGAQKPRPANSESSWYHIGPSWVRFASVVLLFSLTVIAVGVSCLLYFGSPNESRYLADGKFQAVFLNNGQVYFGKIKNISPKYLDLQNIYYLSSQQAQPDQSNKSDQSQQNSFSLIKLGCELHGPYDEMVINRDQVTFWENLKDNGQVSKAIAEWQKQNPNGQQCSTANQNSSSTNNAASNGTNAAAPSQGASNSTAQR